MAKVKEKNKIFRLAARTNGSWSMTNTHSHGVAFVCSLNRPEKWKVAGDHAIGALHLSAVWRFTQSSICEEQLVSVLVLKNAKWDDTAFLAPFYSNALFAVNLPHSVSFCLKINPFSLLVNNKKFEGFLCKFVVVFAVRHLELCRDVVLSSAIGFSAGYFLSCRIQVCT